jgi:hypothetical protein
MPHRTEPPVAVPSGDRQARDTQVASRVEITCTVPPGAGTADTAVKGEGATLARRYVYG